MKQQTSLTRIARCLTLLSLIFFACLISARAQTLTPFVDCVERAAGDGTQYIAYFGYNNTFPGNITVAANTPGNFFSPTSVPSNQLPTIFLPGIHRRVVAVTLDNSVSETWNLASGSATAVFDANRLCGERDGANSRLITYQGRLNDGAAAANGTYDLQFQLFTGVTGTQPRTTLITVEDVSVVNGVFTVQLDLGAATLLPFSAVTGNFKLNPAILDAENTFLEIGVRPGTSTDAFTKLNPRQPLTAVPLAMRANTAATAFAAINADNATNAANLGGVAANQYLTTANADSNYIQNTTTQQTGNFNISGGVVIGGTLTANTLNADGANNLLLNANGSSPVGTWLTLNNTTTGGRNWSVISTGAINGEGAGKLLFRDSTNNIVRLTLSDAGASINGNLTVSGAINGTVSNATNATNVSGGFVQLPLTTNAPPATECDEAAEYGRQKVDAADGKLYICIASGWKSTALQ